MKIKVKYLNIAYDKLRVRNYTGDTVEEAINEMLGKLFFSKYILSEVQTEGTPYNDLLKEDYKGNLLDFMLGGVEASNFSDEEYTVVEIKDETGKVIFSID